MEIKDTYRTITNASEEALFKDKNSKFYGYAFPVLDGESVKQHIENLKKATPFGKTLVLCLSIRYRKDNISC